MSRTPPFYFPVTPLIRFTFNDGTPITLYSECDTQQTLHPRCRSRIPSAPTSVKHGRHAMGTSHKESSNPQPRSCLPCYNCAHLLHSCYASKHYISQTSQMEQRNRFRHYLYSTPAVASSKTTSPESTLSTLSISSADSEHTAIRKDVRRLYRSEELPSIYEPGGLGFVSTRNVYDPGEEGSEFVDVPLTTAREQKLNVVDWDGENDRANPRNWPTWRAGLNIGSIFLMCIISYVLP